MYWHISSALIRYHFSFLFHYFWIANISALKPPPKSDCLTMSIISDRWCQEILWKLVRQYPFTLSVPHLTCSTWNFHSLLYCESTSVSMIAECEEMVLTNNFQTGKKIIILKVKQNYNKYNVKSTFLSKLCIFGKNWNLEPEPLGEELKLLMWHLYLI